MIFLSRKSKNENFQGKFQKIFESRNIREKVY